MGNLTAKNGNHKQKDIVAVNATLDFADADGIYGDIQTSAEQYDIAVLPPGTLIKSMTTNVVTAFDSATSDAANIGIDGGSELASGLDLQSAGLVTTDEAVYLPDGGTLTFLPTYSGGSTSEGQVKLHVEYTVEDRTNGNFTEVLSGA